MPDPEGMSLNEPYQILSVSATLVDVIFSVINYGEGYLSLQVTERSNEEWGISYSALSSYFTEKCRLLESCKKAIIITDNKMDNGEFELIYEVFAELDYTKIYEVMVKILMQVNDIAEQFLGDTEF